MRILTRYLLRAHAGPFVFALTLMTGLLLVNAVARRFQDLAGKGLDLSVILEVFVLSVPHIVALTLPMAVLIAVLYAFSQLAAENEITALKASGVNLARLVMPVAAVGALLTLLMVWFNDSVLPETNHRLKNLLTDVARKSPTLQLKEQVINEIRTSDLMTRYFLQAAEIDPMTNRLKDVVIYDLSHAGTDRTVYAETGTMAFNQDQTDLFLTLQDGYVVTVRDIEPQNFQRLYFDQQLIRISFGDTFQRSETGYRGDREMSVAMLAAEIDRRKVELDSVRTRALEVASNAVTGTLRGEARPGLRSLPPLPLDDEPGEKRRLRGLPAGIEQDIGTHSATNELRMLAAQEDMLRNQVNSYAVEYHKKFSIPFACFAFVLLGAPLAVRFPRGGVGMVIAVSLGIFAIYYIGLRAGEELGDKGIVAPFWAMWITNALALILGLWGMTRVGKEVSTSRGGGWEDLWTSIRGFFARPFTLVLRRAR